MNLYKLEDRNRQRFLKTPKDLILNPCYRNILTSDAKLVYSLLLDRMELSRKNGWVNSNNEIYLIYTKENIADILGISKRTVYKAFNLLEELELINQERQGLNKPNKIYIGKTNPDIAGNCKLCRSEPVKCAGQEVQIMQGSETELSETYNNETEQTHMEPKKTSVAMSIFLEMYQNTTGEQHKAIPRGNWEEVNQLMKDISTEVDHSDITKIISAYFDDFTFKDDMPTLNYFNRVAVRYFGEYCRELFYK